MERSESEPDSAGCLDNPAKSERCPIHEQRQQVLGGVNRDKTHRMSAREGVKFLGVVIGSVHACIAAEKVAALKAKVEAKVKAKVKAITRKTSLMNQPDEVDEGHR